MRSNWGHCTYGNTSTASARRRFRPSPKARSPTATRPRGPQHRYGAILFIEKEGFHDLFKAVRLAERYDLALMSSKDMSVTAARSLIDELTDVPVLVLHDFDKQGFSILGT